MNLIPRNRSLSIICFAIAGFTATLLMSGFLFGSADAQQPPDGWYGSSSSFVYTESNIPTENGNTILAFQQNANGKLTPLPNSPFPTGGAGIADPTFTLFNGAALLIADNDQSVIVNPDRTRLFAVNSGSNTIAVFDIKKDGSLSPVSGSPFPSGGVNPESLGLANDVLYVANRNLDKNNPSQDAIGSQANYTAFSVTPKGRLIPIPKSTVSVPNGGPTQALISRDKRMLFGTEFTGGALRSFRILPGGRLEENPNSPQPLPASEFPPDGPPGLPLGLQVHPRQPILYVGFVTTNKVGVYNYNPVTGELTFVKAVPNSGKAVCWLITNQEGTRLYTANTFDNSVSVYDLADPMTPKEIQRVVLKGNGSATELTLNSNESLLQVVSRRNSADTLEGNGINVLKVNPRDGTLSELDTSPLPIESVDGSFPQGIVSFSAQRFPN